MAAKRGDGYSCFGGGKEGAEDARRPGARGNDEAGAWDCAISVPVGLAWLFEVAGLTLQLYTILTYPYAIEDAFVVA